MKFPNKNKLLVTLFVVWRKTFFFFCHIVSLDFRHTLFNMQHTKILSIKLLPSICFPSGHIINYFISSTPFQIKPFCFCFCFVCFWKLVASFLFVDFSYTKIKKKISLLRPFRETEIKKTGTKPIKWQTNVRKVFGILPLALLNLKGRPNFLCTARRRMQRIK